jgi:hypothetical protein
MLLDKFAPESTPPKSHGRAPLVASGLHCLPRHQGAGGKMATVQEDEEEGEADGVDICGGVSRIAIRDIAEEYGELVEDIGVKLLSPLQRKYVDFAEHGEYVDICGDASPVVFPVKAGGGQSTSPSLSTNYSGSSLSDSDSSSSSDSDSESDPDKSLSRRPAQLHTPCTDTHMHTRHAHAHTAHTPHTMHRHNAHTRTASSKGRVQLHREAANWWSCCSRVGLVELELSQTRP